MSFPGISAEDISKRQIGSGKSGGRAGSHVTSAKALSPLHGDRVEFILQSLLRPDSGIHSAKSGLYDPT